MPQSLITPQTAGVLAIEQKITSYKNTFQTFQAKLINDYNKFHKGVLIARFSILLLTTDERVHIVPDAESAVQRACAYVRTASTLSISDRLQIFWRYV